jgi:hypothetical protein
MKVLALDLSSKAGWAVLNDSKLEAHGLIQLGKTILSFDKYPWAYYLAAQEQADAVCAKVKEVQPDVVVVEETNLGRNRYSQKFLEFLHCMVLDRYPLNASGEPIRIVYISSGVWRKTIGMEMSAEDRRNNSKLSRAKSYAKHTGQKLDKGALGIKGRINKKHLAVRYVNANYGLNLKMKDNDIADAICLGTAFLMGASTCDGT